MRRDCELSFHVKESLILGDGPIEAVVDDELGVGVVIYGNAVRNSKNLPFTVDIEHHADEDNRAIDRTKRHNSVSVHRSTWPSKRQLRLRSLVDTNLVVAHWAVEEPVEAAIAEGIHASVVTTRNREDGDQGNLVQAYVVDAESPFEECDVVTRLLVRFGSQEGL